MTLSLRLWDGHETLQGEEAPPPFNVTFAALHAHGGADWHTSACCRRLQGLCASLAVACMPGVVVQLLRLLSHSSQLGPAGWLCYEPECPLPDSLPLWRMLSGALPGYVQHGELLFRIRASALPSCATDDFDDDDEEEEEAAAAGQLCAQAAAPCLLPTVGLLGPEPRLLGGRILQTGHGWECARLWGTRGFASRRLPATSSAAVQAELQVAQVVRVQGSPDAPVVLGLLLKSLAQAMPNSSQGGYHLPAGYETLVLAVLASQLGGGLLYLLWRFGERGRGCLL